MSNGSGTPCKVLSMFVKAASVAAVSVMVPAAKGGGEGGGGGYVQVNFR